MKIKNIFSKFQFKIILILFLIVAVFVSLIWAVAIGSTKIPFNDVYNIILNNIFGNGENTGPLHDIVWFIRLPRVVLALAVGMGLAICGTVMQAIIKNPIADPYVLGVSSGASLGATFAIMLGVGTMFGNDFVGIMGCIGALSISLLVLMLANVGSKSNSVKILLAGMALSYVCSALSSFIVYMANNKDGMMTITYWLMGSLAGADWNTISVVLPLILICSLFFMTQSRTLNMMLLGDDVSITLGTNLVPYRNLYLVVSSLMIGFIVYSSGIIGFVGLIIPHITRGIVGTNHLFVVPISGLLGAILLIWADVFCRVIIPRNELPIGILISIIGAPFFIYLIVRKSYAFGGGKS